MIRRALAGLFIWLLGAQLAFAAVSFSNTANPAASNDFAGSTVTFTAASFGTATADRLVFFSAAHYNNSESITITSATIGGITATKDASSYNLDSNGLEIGWWWAAVPSGTSGNIVLTLSGSATDESVVITVYSVTGANTSAPVSSSNAASAMSSITASTTVIIPASGAMLVSSNTYRGGSGTTFYAWTNATDDGGATWINISIINGTLEHGNSTTAGSTTVTSNFSSGAGSNTAISAIAIQQASGGSATSNQSLPLSGFGN